MIRSSRHVWVALTNVFRDDALPGVLLDQRREPDGSWSAYVITAEPGIGAHDAGPYVRQCWVPASAVRLVGQDPPAA